MAMLAEPRRRKRYNLCPRGKALYEDDSRFGTKMLEKMGWSKGKGLGANEDGSQEFVRVRFKNDAEGLGYEMRDDQWTIHEEGFNGLLKELNGENSNENETNGNASASEDERPTMGFGFKSEETAVVGQDKPKKLKENISGISLEERSKYSKARVHYKKFTRGKDLAQYSEKDLANIFGKKATDEIEAQKVQEPLEEQKEEEDTPINPNFAGVQTVSTGLSVSDYFKQKMEAMKKRLANHSSKETPAVEIAPVDHEKENEEEPPKKKKKKKDKVREEEQDQQVAEVVDEQPAKKKKKAKHVDEGEVSQVEQTKLQPEETAQPKRKKKKKDRQEEECSAPTDLGPTDETELCEKPAKKKKSKKSKSEDADEFAVTQDETGPAEVEETVEPKREKKKKDRQETEEESPAAAQSASVESEEQPAKKKSKKSKAEKEEPVETLADDKPTKKKIKKSKSGDKESDSAQETTQKTKKKSKKDKSKGDAVDDEAEVSAASVDSSDDEEDSAKFLSEAELKTLFSSFNEYIVSTFCAEKFYMFDMNSYKNSTLAHIDGYRFDETTKLKVIEVRHDAERILQLWAGKNKYKDTKLHMKVVGRLNHKRLHPADIKKIKKCKAFSVM